MAASPSRYLAWHRKCNYSSVMKEIILCSSNPILIKNLYCILRDEGYNVETVEHPALAVQMIMLRQYDFIIVDSEPFGLSAEDAVQIIKTIVPGMSVLFVGKNCGREYTQAVETPIDLEEFKRTIHVMSV
jgi:DNA-binding NtrC family response regulator